MVALYVQHTSEIDFMYAQEQIVMYLHSYNLLLARA